MRGIEDLDARGVAEDLEQVGEVVEKLLVGEGPRASRWWESRVPVASMSGFVSSTRMLIAISFHMNMRSYNLLPII